MSRYTQTYHVVRCQVIYTRDVRVLHYFYIKISTFIVCTLKYILRVFSKLKHVSCQVRMLEMKNAIACVAVTYRITYMLIKQVHVHQMLITLIKLSNMKLQIKRLTISKRSHMYLLDQKDFLYLKLSLFIYFYQN